MRRLILAALLCCAAQAAEARAPRQAIFIECVREGCFERTATRSVYEPARDRGKRHQRPQGETRTAKHVQPAVIGSALSEPRLMPHPEGCPRTAFCGCGAAVKVFGKPIRDLWLARNWFRFPRVAVAPGMVAVRRHHVFVIEQVLGDGHVLAYDANSGGHRTRVHVVSLNGYTVVNPRG